MPDELHPRHLALRVAEIAAVIAVVVIAISALPGTRRGARAPAGRRPGLGRGPALAEVGSCARLPARVPLDVLLADVLGTELRHRDGRAGGQLAAAGGRRRRPGARRLGAPPGRHAHRPHRASHGRLLRVTSAANFFALVAGGHRRVCRHPRGQGIGCAHTRAGGDHRARRAPGRVQPAAAACPRASAARTPTTSAGAGACARPCAPGCGRRRRRGAGDRFAARAQLRRDRRLVRLHGVRHRGARVRLRGRRPCPHVRRRSCSAT